MSVRRTYSQIQPRSPYLIVISDSYPDGAITYADKPYFGVISSAAPFSNLEDYSQASPESENVVVPRGTIFKDLGRSFTLYEAGEQVLIYRECQYVNGPTVEGVSENAPFYSGTYLVRIWSADGYGVPVARLG